MSFKDKMDVWSVDEEDEGGSMWWLVLLVLIPWVVGVGTIFCWLVDNI